MNEFINLARNFFLSYCHIINPNFKRNWHHEEIAKHLEQIAAGKPKRLIISLPPQHGKTFQITQHFPTYYLGRNPKNNIISTSYSQASAEDSGTFVRDLMNTEEYKVIFQSRITQSSKSKKRFSLEQGGNYYAVGRGGPVTGRGAQLIIIDDLIKNHAEALSENYRNDMIDWYKKTLRTRLRKNGSIIVVQTRWHENDLIGHLLSDKSEEWENLVYPAINEQGEALWPELHTIDSLLTQKKIMGTISFQGLYQQQPTSEEGYLIKSAWIQRYKDPPRIFETTIITADLTFKGEKTSDYVVFQKWGKVGPNFYLLDMVRGQWDFTQTLFHMKHFLHKHKDCTNIVIEDAANASAVFSTIKQHVSGVRLWKAQTSKESRLIAVAPLFESNNIFIGEDEKYAILISELLGFPNMAHDDTVDACTMALLNLKNQSSGLIMTLGERIF
jgi:predicted phage terminase large subunit-like protein